MAEERLAFEREECRLGRVNSEYRDVRDKRRRVELAADQATVGAQVLDGFARNWIDGPTHRVDELATHAHATPIC